MVPFAGWDMPVQYGGVLGEARAVREGVGVFDISHMGRIRVSGAGALKHLQRLTTNDLSATTDDGAQYSLIPSESGGILDDIIVYRVNLDQYLVVVNASNCERDWQILNERRPSGVAIADETASTAMVAVQGPQALALLTPLADQELDQVGRFHFVTGSVAGHTAVLCRTGYTGEDGFEVIAGAADAEELWGALVDAGAEPCGLGARDALRTEAGYPLYGHEIHEETSPVEAGLMWAVKPAKGEFTGRSAILEAKRRGPLRKLMGIEMQERVVPRQGYTLSAGGERVGEVTSGAFSALRAVSLGMAYVAISHARPGVAVGVQIRGNEHPATLVAKNRMLVHSA